MKTLKKLVGMVFAIAVMFTSLVTPISAAEISSNIPDWLPSEDQIIQMLTVYKAQESGATKTPAYTRATVSASELEEFYAAANSISDMTWSDFFTGDSYVVRDNGGAYRLDVKPDGELYAKSGEMPNVVMAKRFLANSLFISEWQTHFAWDNEPSLSGQFQCHALSLDTPWEQTTWHLEPWRTESNIVILVLNQCNV